MPKFYTQTVNVPVPTKTQIHVDVFVASSSTQRLEIGSLGPWDLNPATGIEHVRSETIQTGSSSTVKVDIKNSDNNGASWGASRLELSNLVQLGKLNRRVVVSEDDQGSGSDNHVILHFLWWGKDQGTKSTTNAVPFTVPTNTDIHAIAYADASFQQKVELFLGKSTSPSFVLSGSGSPHKKIGEGSTNSGRNTSATAKFAYQDSSANPFKPSKAWGSSVLSLGDYREITAITEDWIDSDANDTVATFMWLESELMATGTNVGGTATY